MKELNEETPVNGQEIPIENTTEDKSTVTAQPEEAQDADDTPDDKKNGPQLVSENEYERLKLSENLPFGILGGLVAGIVCAILWAVISVITHYQLSLMAIGVGIVVGFGVRFAGKGITPVFGIVGAVIALASCLFGNFLTAIGFVANEFDMHLWETLTSFDYSFLPAILKETFEPMDILFYAIAVYTGYAFGFKKVQVV